MNTQWLTRTAVILALALSIQIIRLPQLVTGPAVNALLLLAVILVGPAAAVLIGCLTPLVALLVGIIPPIMLPMVPVIMLANATLVAVFSLVMQRPREGFLALDLNLRSLVAMVSAALAKFLLFYLSINYILNWFKVPLPLAVAAVFGITQLYTALAGGLIALILGKYLLGLLSPAGTK